MTTEQRTASSSSGAASQVREELGQDAERLKDNAQDRAREEAETRKSQAVRVAGSAASALDRAAGDLERDKDAPDWLASAVRQAAGTIDRMAGEMEGRDIGEIGHTVTRFARSNPGSFLAASAAAGFAAARVLRAGADKKRHDHGASGRHQVSAGSGQTSSDRSPGAGGATSRSDTYSGFTGGGAT